ncbi:MAG TPA: ABC transporter substrate-binding protein [Actinomycetales bacterium]|nr:ABC transporter substrate-binding protein [Actinomycetales bacterium]
MRTSRLIPIAATGALLLAACAPNTESGTTPAEDSTTTDATTTDATTTEESDANTAAGPGSTQIEEIDLDALIEAAKAEPALVVLDGTSKVQSQGELFAETYGLEIDASKADASESVEILTREAAAGTITTDVAALSDVPSINNELLASGVAFAWLPADIAANIDASQQNPPILINDPAMWSYNTEVYEACPVSNMWELTDEEWSGLVALDDPLNNPGTLDWFSQMDQFGNDALEAAYESHYGEAFSSDEGRSATQEWVARFAANSPLLTLSSEEASEAIGAPGQTTPPVGLLSSAKFRNIDELGYALGVCEGMEPWVGMAKPKGIVIASGTESPNAAKLWVHFNYTQEGIQAQIDDGKMSTNSEIVQPEDPADIGHHTPNIFTFDGGGVDRDWESRQDWSDLWRLNN